MPDRPLVQEICELGIEAAGSAGTPVPSTVKLQGLQLDFGTALNVDRFGPAGDLWDTIAAPRQEWGEGSVSGFPTYPEMAYVLSNVFGTATVTTPTGATNARRWYWQPSSSTPWQPRTWTVRRGMPGNTAELASYGLMTGVNLSFTRTAAPEIGGDFITRILDYSASVGATGLTVPSVVPILPAQVCVYLDPTAGAIGTTRLTRDFLTSVEISGLFGPIWPLDCTIASFAATVPLKPDTTVHLQLGNDAQGREPVTAMRLGDSRFCRIQATGPQIDAGPPVQNHRLTIDLALKVVDAPARGDSDGLSTLDWTFGIFNDPTFGKAMSIELITNLATL